MHTTEAGCEEKLTCDCIDPSRGEGDPGKGMEGSASTGTALIVASGNGSY
ncbi:MAG TPA: hypothetical protein V6C97_14250 [Oculatellaceae cyanobacterium]